MEYTETERDEGQSLDKVQNNSGKIFLIVVVLQFSKLPWAMNG